MKSTKRPRRVVLPLLNDDPSGVPWFSAQWVPGLLGRALPDEPHATCSSGCAMLPPPGDSFERDGPYFNASRCCTYAPALANYLVGALLLDPDRGLDEGRARLRARIARRTGLSPFGMRPSARERKLVDDASDAAFGRHDHFVCPYFRSRDGGCTIWRHRNGVCMSWFCKHERGAKGHAAWRFVERLTSLIEQSVAYHCVRELDAGDALASEIAGARSELSAADLDDTDTEAHRRAVWGSWLGREEAFYEACAKIAFGLDAESVLRLGGAELALTVTVTTRALASLASPLADPLVVRPFDIASLGRDDVSIATYSPYDPITLPFLLVPLLGAFDGRGTGEVVAALRAEHGVELDDELLVQLVDFGLLAPTP